MFEFKSQQQTFSIGGVSVGGPPGKNPTVLIGSMFYYGHKIVSNDRTGEFDRKKAEELIKLQEEFSDKTGNPCMLDIVGSTPGAIKKFLAFAAEVAEVPVLIDSPMIEARVAGLEYAKETGIIDRVVYNSLILQHKQEELQKIKDTGLDSAILLAYDPKAFTTIGRIEAIRELLKVAHKIGINKPLIDTCVLDIPSLGMALRSLFDLKNELGLPTGCGAHNAVSTWRGLKGKMGKEAIKPVIASASAITAAVGADFVMYGPIEDSRYVFPAVAMTNAAFGFLLVEKKERLDRKHPLFRIP